MTAFKPPVTVALTGASGAQYGLRLIDVLVEAGHEVWVMISKAAHMVIATETDVSLPAQPQRLVEALTEKAEPNRGRSAVLAERTGWHPWPQVPVRLRPW